MRILWLSTLLSVLGSVVSTWTVEGRLDAPITLIDPWFRLSRSLNDGIAFGVNLPEALQTPLIVLALIIIAFYAARTATHQAEELSFGLIIGGGIGNLIDRLQDGHVTDFIQVGSFPVFNIADTCISLGVGILLLGFIIDWESVERGVK